RGTDRYKLHFPTLLSNGSDARSRRVGVFGVNCSFYFKIGACRHGDRCSRLHNKPTFSQTIVLLNLYRNPQNTAQTADGSHCHVSDVEVQEHYDNFFEEVFTELQEKYGEIEEMNVCDNLGDHLVGNVYVKVTPKIPHRPPSPRKESTPFPRPPAWSLLRLVLLFLTQGQRRSCAGSLLKALFTPAPPRLQNFTM
ncbi:Splicing factor U2AF 26 kDa subunit, partial [Lemmus lemmus]